MIHIVHLKELVEANILAQTCPTHASNTSGVPLLLVKRSCNDLIDKKKSSHGDNVSVYVIDNE